MSTPPTPGRRPAAAGEPDPQKSDWVDPFAGKRKPTGSGGAAPGGADAPADAVAAFAWGARASVRIGSDAAARNPASDHSTIGVRLGKSAGLRTLRPSGPPTKPQLFPFLETPKEAAGAKTAERRQSGRATLPPGLQAGVAGRSAMPGAAGEKFSRPSTPGAFIGAGAAGSDKSTSKPGQPPATGVRPLRMARLDGSVERQSSVAESRPASPSKPAPNALPPGGMIFDSHAKTQAFLIPEEFAAPRPGVQGQAAPKGPVASTKTPPTTRADGVDTRKGIGAPSTDLKSGVARRAPGAGGEKLIDPFSKKSKEP